MKKFKYMMHNASTTYAIDQAARLNMNWVIVHSMGIETIKPDKKTGRPKDHFPIYFRDYPAVAEGRRYRDSNWLEPLRREVRALCERADRRGLNVAFQVYEPSLPRAFETEYPEIVGVHRHPTQEGILPLHSHLDPDNPAAWELLGNKYREIAEEFPWMKMLIITTWDGNGSMLCIPDSKMPIHERLLKLVKTAGEALHSVRDDIIVCFRFWGRNWPENIYRDGHRLIEEVTGLKEAGKYMNPIARPHNDPDKVIKPLLENLPDDVPIMYKSTPMDIDFGSSLTEALGTYPTDREQILEISYEMHHVKPWPWCKVTHIRRGLEAVEKYDLAGFIAVPMNMGNNTRSIDPEKGNLGRMNTWLLERMLAGDAGNDAELVGAWLEKEFGTRQPEEAVEVLLEADRIVGEGIQWGGGVPSRAAFASLHTTKLYWFFDGFINSEFPYKMAEPDAEWLNGLLEMKQAAYESACLNLERINAARHSMDSRLYDELESGYKILRDAVLLHRDWHSFLLFQYGIEKGIYPSDRRNLARMSRYAESFIKNLVELGDSSAAEYVKRHLSFPDPFPIV